MKSKNRVRSPKAQTAKFKIQRLSVQSFYNQCSCHKENEALSGCISRHQSGASSCAPCCSSGRPMSCWECNPAMFFFNIICS
jgi:hypothetical protein